MRKEKAGNEKKVGRMVRIGRIGRIRIRKEGVTARKRANIAPSVGWIITTRKNTDTARKRRTVASMPVATAPYASNEENLVTSNGTAH
jgi:hypothetical protein